jgi:hypothetical protein
MITLKTFEEAIAWCKANEDKVIGWMPISAKDSKYIHSGHLECAKTLKGKCDLTVLLVSKTWYYDGVTSSFNTIYIKIPEQDEPENYSLLKDYIDVVFFLPALEKTGLVPDFDDRIKAAEKYIRDNNLADNSKHYNIKYNAWQIAHAQALFDIGIIWHKQISSWKDGWRKFVQAKLFNEFLGIDFMLIDPIVDEEVQISSQLVDDDINVIKSKLTETTEEEERELKFIPGKLRTKRVTAANGDLVEFNYLEKE